MPGHDFGSVSDAVFPCLAAEFGKSFVIGEQIGHMLMHPLRGQVLVCDQKAAAGVTTGSALKRCSPLPMGSGT